MAEVIDETDSQRLQRKDREQREQARRKSEAERQRLLDERQAHLEDIAIQNEIAKSEIETLMVDLKETERRLIRLHAATIVHGLRMLTGSRNQEIMDEMTLRLARYAVTGKA